MHKYFCTVYENAEKTDLSKGYWNPERKLGGNHVFFSKVQLIKLHFRDKNATYNNYIIFIVMCFKTLKYAW